MIWLLPAALPPAEGAVRWVAAWRARAGADPPWLALVPESRHAAWAEALRAALEAGPATPCAPAALQQAVRAGAELGGALISGGLPADEGHGAARPALFVNLPPSRALLRAWTAPVPVLALAPQEPHVADLAALPPELAQLREFAG